MTILKLFICCFFVSQVSCIIPGQSYVGTAISATALALSIPHYFIFKSHLRILDFLQLIYLFSLINPLYTNFAGSLSDSWLKFMPNFYSSICDATGFACNVGYSLSAGTVLFGIILLALFITGVEKCRKPDKIQFMPVFTLFKGFVRWVYISLVSVSALFIYMYMLALVGNMFSNLVAPAIVLGICLIYPLMQLIAAKCSETPETEDTKSKWAEFLGVFRLFAVGILVALQSISGITLICVGSYIVLVGVAVGYSLLFKFSNIPERVLVGVEQTILVTLFSLYTFKPDAVSSTDLDFYLVCAIFLFEFIYEIYSWVIFIKKAKSQVQMAPIDSIKKVNARVNSFNDDSMDNIHVQLPPTSKNREDSPLRNDILRGSNEYPLKNESPARKKR